MDSTHLQTFLSVAQLGSFTEAAEALYVSQSAVSKRIAALEGELNCQLLDRIGKRVLLTEAGKVLAARAKALLLEMEDTRREIHNLSQHVSGRVSVGTSHHVGLHRLPDVLRQFVSQYPEVELDLRFLSSEHVCQAVQQGDLELGIITLPLQPMEHLTMQPVWEDTLEFVVGPSHPLVHQLVRKSLTNPVKGQEVRTTLKTLAEHGAILPSPGTYTREIIEAEFARQQIALHTRMQTDYLETIKMLVNVGLGWSLLPKKMLQDNSVLTLQIPNAPVNRTLGAVWHASRILSNAARRLLSLLDHAADQSVSVK